MRSKFGPRIYCVEYAINSTRNFSAAGAQLTYGSFGVEPRSKSGAPIGSSWADRTDLQSATAISATEFKIRDLGWIGSLMYSVGDALGRNAGRRNYFPKSTLKTLVFRPASKNWRPAIGVWVAPQEWRHVNPPRARLLLALPPLLVSRAAGNGYSLRCVAPT